ncbi:MAG: lipopolysaccharide heptosyltransferase II, partial [Desulfuromonadales bacterium]|nr:lipopolysaccharide heptosyltransferase II [Desulfuromonadales bacterium]
MKVLHPEHVERIMVRTTNWIGDAVMMTPALRAVRESFPNAEITIVANPLVAQLFEAHPDCNRVIVFDKRSQHGGVRGFWRFCRILRRERFDLAILFQNAIEAGFMALLGGIPRRMGYATDGRRLLLTHPVVVGDAERSLHHTDYYLNMLAYYDIRCHEKAQSLALRADERAWAAEQLPDGPVATINPGAAYGSAKRWFPDRFAAVGDYLAEVCGMTVILTGGPGEAEIGRDIAAAMKTPPLNFFGRTSVRQMMALLAASSIMVTNDSGPMHVGAAFGVPLDAIFGP